MTEVFEDDTVSVLTRRAAALLLSKGRYDANRLRLHLARGGVQTLLEEDELVAGLDISSGETLHLAVLSWAITEYEVSGRGGKTLDLSPSGRMCITGGDSTMVFDLATGETVYHDANKTHGAVLLSDTTLLRVTEKGVQMIDTQDGNKKMPLSDQSSRLSQVSASTNGVFAARCGLSVEIFGEDGKLIRRVSNSQVGKSIAVSPCGKYLAQLAGYREVEVLEVHTGRKYAVKTEQPGDSNGVVVWSKDSSDLFVGRGTVLYVSRNAGSNVTPLNGHSGHIVAITSTDTAIYSAAEDQSVRQWDRTTLTCLSQTHFPCAIRALQSSRCERFMVYREGTQVKVRVLSQSGDIILQE